MFCSIVRRGVLHSAATCWIAIVWFGLARVGVGEEPAKKTEGDSRETIDRIAKGYELFLGVDSLPLEMEAEPVLRWPNATRDTQEGATYVWTRDGRPEAIGDVWEKGGFWSYGFHSLSSSRVLAKYNGKTIWQSEKTGIEFSPFPKAPDPADSAVKRLVQMKDLARRFKCHLKRIKVWATLRFLNDGSPFCCGEPGCHLSLFGDRLAEINERLSGELLYRSSPFVNHPQRTRSE